MTFIRTSARIDDEGKLSLPNNIKKFAGFTDGEVVELTSFGPSGKILISKKVPGKTGHGQSVGHPAFSSQVCKGPRSALVKFKKVAGH